MGRWLRTSEVADLLHLSVSSVRLIPESELPVDRTPTPGRHRRYDPAKVAAYMRQHGLVVPDKLTAVLEDR